MNGEFPSLSADTMNELPLKRFCRIGLPPVFTLKHCAHGGAHSIDTFARFDVTTHPTAAWTAQQLRDAFPWDDAPRHLIRSREQAFLGLADRASAVGTQ